MAALVKAFERVSTATGYSQDNRMGATQYDCSSLVGRCYQDVGANVLISGDEGTVTNVAGIVSYQDSTGWTHISKIAGAGSVAGLQQNLQPGDLLIKIGMGGSNHISFFAGWSNDEKTKMVCVAARSSKSGVNAHHISTSYQSGAYNIIGRPNAAASSSTGADFASGTIL